MRGGDVQMKRGIIYTLDAILAGIVALSFVFICMSYLSANPSEHLNALSLTTLDQDTLSVLEKDGVLADALQGDALDLGNFLDALPSNICAEIFLYDTDMTLYRNITKTGCLPSDDVVITRRVFFAGNATPYYAKLRGWYNE